jgi:hypothetical protein
MYKAFNKLKFVCMYAVCDKQLTRIFSYGCMSERKMLTGLKNFHYTRVLIPMIFFFHNVSLIFPENHQNIYRNIIDSIIIVQ